MKIEIDAIDIIEFFKNCNIFRYWSQDSIEKLASNAELHRFKAKQVILNNSLTTNKVFLIKSGNALVWTKMKKNPVRKSTYQINNERTLQEASHLKPYYLNDCMTPLATNANNSKDNFKSQSEVFNIKQEFRLASKSSENFRLKRRNAPKTSKSNNIYYKLPTLTALNSLNNSRAMTSRPRTHVTFDTEPIKKQETYFLQVSKLKQGDSFGFNIDEQNSDSQMQLVSEDCECFILPKDLIKSKAPVNFFKLLKYQTTDVPSKQLITTKFNEYLTWKSYTKKLFNEIATKHVKLKQKSVQKSF